MDEGTQVMIFDIKREARKLPNGMVEVKVTPPPISGFKGGASVTLTPEQFERMLRWLRGHEMIQECLPDLSPEDREILMTGIGPKEWDETFKEDE